MKNISLLLLLAVFAGCTATGPAEDKWDREENEDKIGLGKMANIFGGKDKKTEEENEELKRRIERLEQNQGIPPKPSTQTTPTTQSSDITAPPSVAAQPTRQQTQVAPGDTVSYQEWQRARQQNNDEYKEFKEYKEWLEFKKQKEQK